MRRVWYTGVVALAAVSAAGAAELSARDVADARKLYNAKCAKCHKFYNPANYDDAEWNKWMTKMSRKAKLKPAQAESLSRYLDTFRRPAGTNASGAAPAPKQDGRGVRLTSPAPSASWSADRAAAVR